MSCKITTLASDQLLAFQSRESALAVKSFVKRLFAPTYLYPDPIPLSAQQSNLDKIQNICNQNGPSFFKSCLSSPNITKITRLKKKAFVSKKMNEKSLSKTKNQIERSKQQTEVIQGKMRFTNPIQTANFPEKKLIKRGTNRSTTASSSRKQFKNSFIFD